MAVSLGRKFVIRSALDGSCVCVKMVEERVRVVRCGGSRLNFRRAVFSVDSKYAVGRGPSGLRAPWAGEGIVRRSAARRPAARLESAAPGGACADPELPGPPGFAAAPVCFAPRTLPAGRLRGYRARAGV